MRRFALPAFVLLSLVGCRLPDRRPDAEFRVTECSTGINIGSFLPHRACIRLYAGRSSVHADGPAQYQWSAIVYPPGTNFDDALSVTPIQVFDDLRAIPNVAVTASNGGQTLSGRFFQDVAEQGAPTLITLLVTDAAGKTRETAEQVYLFNAPPLLLNDPTPRVRPRSFDLFYSPWLIVYPLVEDLDAELEDDRVTYPGDALAITVTQLSPADPALSGVLCSTLIPNPALDPFTGEGSPNAWCFDATPALSRPDPIDFHFGIHVRETGTTRPPSPVPADPCAAEPEANGEILEPRACVVIRLEDVTWVASGGVSQGGVIGRVAPGWIRRGANNTSLRNAFTAEYTIAAETGPRVWFAGDRTDVDCSDQWCPGAVVGFNATSEIAALFGLGAVRSLAAGPSGLWAIAMGTTTSGSPSTPALGGIEIPYGDPYAVFLGDPLLDFSTGAPLDLDVLDPDFFLVVHGLAHADSVEIPGTIEPTLDGAIWMTMAHYCKDLIPNAVQDELPPFGTCNPNWASVPAPNFAVREYRLKRVPLSSLVNPLLDPDGWLDLEVPSNAALVTSNFELALLPGDGSSLDALAADATGGIWFVDTLPDFTARIRHFQGSNPVADRTFTLAPSYPLSIAYDSVHDLLWVSDAISAGVIRIESPGQIPDNSLLAPEKPSGTAPPPPVSLVYGPLTIPISLTPSPDGGLWIDDHPDFFRRQAVYVPAAGEDDSLTPVFLGPYESRGMAIQNGPTLPGLAPNTGVWRSDQDDAVRSPLHSPQELPALHFGTLGATLAGVDPHDGAAYVISPIVGGNLFRVAANGESRAVLELPATARCGVLVPDLPSDDSLRTVPGSLWLSLAGPQLVEIDVRRLRSAAEHGDITLQSCTQLDGSPLPIDAGVCFKTVIDEAALDPDGTLGPQEPAETFSLIFSPVDFRLYGAGFAGGVAATSALVSVHLKQFGAVPDAPELDAFALGVPVFGGPMISRPQAAFLLDPLGAELGGTWIVENDGSIVRWHESGGTIVSDETFRIQPDPALGGFVARSISADPITGAVWLSSSSPFSSVVPSFALERITLTAAGPGDRALWPMLFEGESIAASPFSSAVWLSGDSGSLWRFRSQELSPSSHTLFLEYVRPPDYTGASPVPAGQSLDAGGL